jgi:hypothetical protein
MVTDYADHLRGELTEKFRLLKTAEKNFMGRVHSFIDTQQEIHKTHTLKKVFLLDFPKFCDIREIAHFGHICYCVTNELSLGNKYFCSFFSKNYIFRISNVTEF